MTAEGDLMPEPLFIKSSLGDPAHRIAAQAAGPIHIHPNGRFVYQGNRSGVGGGVVPGIEEVAGKLVYSGGESNIAVYAINQETGEPTAIQHADIHAAHPRTFSLDAAAKLLVAGSLAPTAIRQDGKVVTIPAGLTVFKVGADGKLELRAVTVVAYGERSIGVSQGGAASDKVVVQGVHTLTAGEKVKPVAPLHAEDFAL